MDKLHLLDYPLSLEMSERLPTHQPLSSHRFDFHRHLHGLRDHWDCPSAEELDRSTQTLSTEGGLFQGELARGMFP